MRALPAILGPFLLWVATGVFPPPSPALSPGGPQLPIDISAKGPPQSIPDWENPAVFGINKEAPRATAFPFEDIESARGNAREASEYFRLLNGDWRFNWVRSPGERPRISTGRGSTIRAGTSFRCPPTGRWRGTGPHLPGRTLRGHCGRHRRGTRTPRCCMPWRCR